MKLRRTGKTSAVAVLAVVPALVLVGCGSSNSGHGAQGNSGPGSASSSIGGTPVKGGTLVVGSTADSCSYVPTLCTVSFSGSAVQDATLDHLVVSAKTTQGWTTSLAKSVTANGDSTVWTVKLPTDVKYSDGSAFTATDVMNEFQNYALAKTSPVAGDLTALKSVQAPDPSTVTFTLNASNARFPNVLTLVPLFKPTPGLKKTDIPVGTGPFKISKVQAGVQITLDRNPYYYGKASDGTQLPYLDHLVFKPIVSPDTRLATLQSGGISVALIEDPITYAQATKLSGVRMLSVPSDDGAMWLLNTTGAPTDDIRVRQALAYATDRDALKAAVGGGVTARNEYFDPSGPFYSKEADKATPSFDLAKAKGLVAQYVADPKRSDHKPVGTPVSLTLNYVNGSASQQSLTQVAQQQWGAAGFKVSVVPDDEATLITDVIKGNFAATYFEWATKDPYALFQHNYSPFPADLTNFSKFNSDQMQQDIAKMGSAQSADELKAAVNDANLLIATKLPIIAFQSTVHAFAAKPADVANLAMTYAGDANWAVVAKAKG